MTTTSGLIDTGQRLWLEGLARDQETNGLLADDRQRRSIAGLSVTIDACGKAVQAGTAFDQLIQGKLKEGLYGGRLAMELLVADARHAADLLLPSFEQSGGLNGWVAVPSSPLFNADATNMAETVSPIDARCRQPNLMVSIAGLPSRLPDIESLIAAGISINVDLLFSSLQFRAVAEAILQAFESCVVAGREPLSSCFLTIPVDRLLAGFRHLFPEKSAVACVNAVLLEVGEVARNLLETRRWQRIIEMGAQPPHLICSFADSIELCRSSLSLVKEIGAVSSIAARSRDTEFFFADFNPAVRDQARNCNERQQNVLDSIGAGIDIAVFTDRLQKDQADASLRSWIALLDTIARKSAALITARNVQSE